MPSKSRPGLAIAIATVVTAASGLTVLLAPTAAMAAGCEAQPNGQTVCSFDTPGKYEIPVPAGSSAADATLVGGAGGPGEDGATGGDGETIHGTLNLPSASGLMLDIYVGAGGGSGADADCEEADGLAPGGHSDGPTGGVHGGDGGSSAGSCGGGGGGGTFVLVHGVKPTDTGPGDKPLAAAGGGGGGGGGTDSPNGGGNGGTPDGAPGAGAGGGQPGTQQNGGEGGTGASAGSRGNGGAGADEGSCNCAASGGGGGGGFFGGGGGAAGFGGGGGSGCMNCVAPDSGDFRTTSIPGTPQVDHPDPVFRMAQNGSNGSVMLIFGNIIAPSGQRGGTPARPNSDHHGHGSGGNDPNPNTNPAVPSSSAVSNTVTASCNPRLGVCQVRPPAGPDSQFAVTATGGNSRATLFGTLMGGSKPDCPNYTELNTDWVSFGFLQAQSGSSWQKTTKLTTRHKLSHDGAVALSRRMQICFEAPYRFLTRAGYQLGGRNSLFDGVLPDCSAIGSAEKGVARPCVSARQVLSRKGGWVVRFTFKVPANSKDPKALG